MQTILITGAASGIGRAAVLRAAELGWRCIAVDRDAHGLQQLLHALPPSALGPHQAHVLDVLDTDAVKQLGQQVPTLDALVNNAGMSSTCSLPLVEQSDADHHRLLQLNLHAPAMLVQALRSRMTAAARVVNVASGAGLRAIPWRGLYSASKAGLIAQTQALARTQTDWGVTVLCPGFVRTALVDSLLQSGRLCAEAALAKVPLGRMAEPEEIAHAICFLATPEAHLLSGQVLAVDGGSSVYGGSQVLPAATAQCLPCSIATRWRVVGLDDSRWLTALSPACESNAYDACVDFSAWNAPLERVLDQVLEAARHFAQRHRSVASLTLVIPHRPEPVHWRLAAVHAAARMLIGTLACEWASQGLRINAIEVGTTTDFAALQALLAYVGSAQAQYVTGQTLVCANSGACDA